jgi:long-chain acyl-CoA synthetase
VRQTELSLRLLRKRLMRVEDFLRQSARRVSGRNAIICGGQSLSFAELDQMSERMAAALSANDIGGGDPIIVFMDNSWQLAVSIFAILKAGALFSLVEPSASTDELVHAVNDCRAAGLVTESRLAVTSALAMAAGSDLRLTVIAGCEGSPAINGILRFEDAIAAKGAPSRPPRTRNGDVAALIYSHSLCRRVAVTHDELALGLSDDIAEEVLPCPEPLFTDDGLRRLLAATKCGTTLVLESASPLASLRQPPEAAPSVTDRRRRRPPRSVEDPHDDAGPAETPSIQRARLHRDSCIALSLVVL